METKDKPRFMQIMLGMADNFGDEISKEGLAMRFDMLSEYSIEDIEAAAKKILRNRKFKSMPPVAEFHEAIHGSDKTKALEAWGAIMKGLEIDEMPTDPKSQEIIRRIGGWIWLGLQTYDELKWVEKRFVEHWDACPDESILKLEDGRVAELLENIGMNLIKRPF